MAPIESMLILEVDGRVIGHQRIASFMVCVLADGVILVLAEAGACAILGMGSSSKFSFKFELAEVGFNPLISE